MLAPTNPFGEKEGFSNCLSIGAMTSFTSEHCVASHGGEISGKILSVDVDLGAVMEFGLLICTFGMVEDG